MNHLADAERGMALIDALIASAVLGIGLAGTTQLTLKTFRLAIENRQHTVAQLLAQEAMDCWHLHAQGCSAHDDIVVQGVRYARQVQSTLREGGWVVDLQVSVAWASGTPATPHVGTQQGGDGTQRILWHSSASTLPLWVGVSSP